MKTGYGIKNAALFAAMLLMGGAAWAAPDTKEAASSAPAAKAAQPTAFKPAASSETANPESTNVSGATSTGGSFFVPPQTKEGTVKGQSARNAMTGTEVPEPGMIGLFGAGIVGLALARLRLRRKAD